MGHPEHLLFGMAHQSPRLENEREGIMAKGKDGDCFEDFIEDAEIDTLDKFIRGSDANNSDRKTKKGKR